jgi:starch synthase
MAINDAQAPSRPAAAARVICACFNNLTRYYYNWIAIELVRKIRKDHGMRVLFVTPEVEPVSRVGGLAEYSQNLPLALGEMGHRVDIITPKLRMDAKTEARLVDSGVSLQVPVSWRVHHAGIKRLDISEQVSIHLIDHGHLFDRDGLYGNEFGGYEDNAERFVFLSRAALELARKLDGPIDLVHCNDWTTALVPLFIKSHFENDPVFKSTASVMVIHNLAHKGLFWHYDMPLLGLGWDYFTPESLEFYGKISFLKAGLIYGDKLCTVSPSYHKELLTPEGGGGLDGLIRNRLDDFIPILNGVDHDAWNPKTDPNLAANYDVDDLTPKAACKRDLLERFALQPDTMRPLAVFVGRLLDRRGVDILAPCLEDLLEMGLNVAIMGNGDDHYHGWLRRLSNQNKGRMGLKIGYDATMDHQMTAGADIMLMPSRFEPCGLHQMHAMRYGTVPLVRATGGLDDTVDDHNANKPGTGFKFSAYTSQDMLEAVKRSLAVYANSEEWLQLMKRCMAKDFSWNKPARDYVSLYQQAIDLRRGIEGV